MGLTVIIQFLMEVTLGRVFYAPSLVPFMLVYLSENFESFWSVDGAFWSGLALDSLLHQPLGSSSLALLAGMYVADRFGRISSGEGRGFLLGMTLIATAVSDTVFILLASRPLGTGFSSQLLVIFPRLAVTAFTTIILLSAMGWLAGRRPVSLAR
jgi:hypothetical protein